MTPYLQDPDVTLYHGDVLDVLREMEAESVDCVVTSPPYWGLRDYGTPGQLGLEPTPEHYVERMVEVFREVRRVLAPHGTVWLNLGDSFAGSPAGNKGERRIGDGGQIWENKPFDSSKGTGLKQKDLCGIPWRVAFALQADGWYLRSDIIWAKPNPMPESVTDRPTKAHEYVFLLSKQPRYFFDQEAVREPWSENTHPTRKDGGQSPIRAAYLKQPSNGGQTGLGAYKSQARPGLAGGAYSPPGQSPHGNARGPDGRAKTSVLGGDGSIQHRDGERWPNGGRNIRSVWEIATQPYPLAHFATFPEELARRCIAAGTSERGKCPECGAPWVRDLEREPNPTKGTTDPNMVPIGASGEVDTRYRSHSETIAKPPPLTLGWRPSCDCRERDFDGATTAGDVYAPIPGIVLDPFVGSGTTCHVARKLGRRSVGIDLSAEYLALAAKRLQQQSLFALDNGAERSPSAERTKPELTQAAADRSSEAVQANKGKVTSDSP